MTDYGTIKIPHDEYERHNEQRQDMGLTWAAYIDGQAPGVPNGAEVDADDLAARIVDQVGGPQVDDSEIARTVARKLDYAELATQVADEVEGRMR